VTGSHRIVVGALVLLAVLGALLLVLYAGATCPAATAGDPCPDAGLHRSVVIALGSISAALLATPFAFLAEVVTRRRIVYRGAWGRAARRGLLIGALVAVLAALRLGGALSVPLVLFLLVVAALAEWFAVRRMDVP
jgi:hypothetical protein